MNDVEYKNGFVVTKHTTRGGTLINIWYHLSSLELVTQDDACTSQAQG